MSICLKIHAWQIVCHFMLKISFNIYITWIFTFAEIHASKCEKCNQLQNIFFFLKKKNKKEKERERQERELGGIFWISDEWLGKKKLYSTHSMIYFDSTVLFHGRWSTGTSCYFLSQSSSFPCKVSCPWYTIAILQSFVIIIHHRLPYSVGAHR